MKDSLEYLNDIKIDLNEYEEYTLTDLEKQKMKRNIKKIATKSKRNSIKKQIIKVGSIIAMLFISLLVFGITFPTYAEDIPGFKYVIEFLNRNNEMDVYEESSTPIMANIKMDGYDINIKSAYYDGMELVIFYNVIGEEKLDTDKKYWFDTEVDFNIEVEPDPNVDPQKKKDLINQKTCECVLEYGEFINDNTFAGMVNIYITPGYGNVPSYYGSHLPEVLSGKIDITKLYIGDNIEKSIKIEAEPIELSLDSRDTEIKEYAINRKVDFEENSQEFIKAREYPTGIFIEDKRSIVDFGKLMSYKVWDSNNGQLKALGFYETEDGASSIQYRLPSKDGDVYIIPYVDIHNVEFVLGERYSNKHLIKMEKSKYDLGVYGTFEILEINDEEDKTVMRVRATGWQTDPYLILTGDKDEEYYDPIYEKDKKILGILDMEVTYVFNKLDKEKNYYLETSKSNLVILKDQIIKIEKK